MKYKIKHLKELHNLKNTLFTLEISDDNSISVISNITDETLTITKDLLHLRKFGFDIIQTYQISFTLLEEIADNEGVILTYNSGQLFYQKKGSRIFDYISTLLNEYNVYI